MKKHLKHQAPFVQLVILGCLTLVFLFLGGVVLSPLIMKLYGLPFTSFATLDFSKPKVLELVKLLQTVVSIMLFLFPALAFAYFADSKPLRFIGFRQPAPRLFYLIAVFSILCAIPLVAWLGEMNQHMHLPASLNKVEKWMRDSENESNDFLKHMLEMKSGKDLLITVIILGAVPAFIEEVFFRGVLQRIFIQATRRPWIGILITAIIFSAIHAQFLGFFPRLLLGVVLGCLCWYSGSIWPGVLAHFINNALQIVLVYYNPKFVEAEPNFSAVIVTASTIAIIALTWWMTRYTQTSYSEVYDTDDDFVIGTKDQYIA